MEDSSAFMSVVSSSASDCLERLVSRTRIGRRLDSNPYWKRRRRPGRPRHTLVRQVEIDTGVSADEAWDCGALPLTAANGGRYDPSWSRVADDDER